jgi:hypothetical protein
MFKFKHSSLIVIAGLIWLGIGVFLLNIGLKLIITCAQLVEANAVVSAPFLRSIAPFLGGSESAGIMLLAFSLFLGYFKGRFVLMKSACRVVNRIRSLPSPISLHRIYSPKFLFLIGGMMLLGVLFRVFNAPGDIRGAIDVIVGSALVSGSLVYFRLAGQVKKDALASSK